MNYTNAHLDTAEGRAFLQEKRHGSRLSTGAMALLHDLDGALREDQHGLAWMSQEQLLWMALRIWLRRRGRPLPDTLTEAEAGLAALAIVESFAPRLAAAAWDLLSRPFPQPVELAEGVERTLSFIRFELRMPELTERASSIGLWADDIDLLRTVASTLGITQGEQWYLAETDDGDWYADAVGHTGKNPATTGAE